MDQITNPDKELLLEVNKRLKRHVSFWQNILIGIIRGVGSVIGATLVVGLLGAALVGALDTAKQIPVLDTIIDYAEAKLAQ